MRIIPFSVFPSIGMVKEQPFGYPTFQSPPGKGVALLSGTQHATQGLA